MAFAEAGLALAELGRRCITQHDCTQAIGHQDRAVQLCQSANASSKHARPAIIVPQLTDVSGHTRPSSSEHAALSIAHEARLCEHCCGAALGNDQASTSIIVNNAAQQAIFQVLLWQAC